MVKVYDPDAKLRDTRNFFFLSVIYGSIILMFVIIPIYITFFLIQGQNSFLILIKKNILIQFQLLVKAQIYFLKFWYHNRLRITFSTANFFVIKVFAPSLISYTLLLALIAKYWSFVVEFRIFKKDASLHGDAHWANEKEIRKLGLLNNKGMLIGTYKGKSYLSCDDFQHVLLFAPTGSGKGVGFIIPNLLFWEESLIVHDIKLENFEKGSKYRKQELKQEVFAWVPADFEGRSHCYNPMDWVSAKPGQQVDDVMKLANILLPKQEFWTNEARTLLTGLMLMIIGDPTKQYKTFGEIVRTIRSENYAFTIASALDVYGEVLNPICLLNLQAFLQKADKERSGVVSTLNSGLELWANPIIDATTSRSDFNFNNFKIRKTTVFVGLTPDNIQRLQPLMKIFYQQATAFMSQHMPTPEEKYGVMFMMDEFPTVGKLEIFLSGIAYFRGYRVKLFLIVQDTQQLKGVYEDTGMNSFLSNSTYRITFAANNNDTAKLISDLIGNQTVEADSTSKAKYFDPNPGNKSVSISQQSRALLLPQEVITLPRDEEIILIEASAPIRTKKIFWYKIPMFVKRVLPFDPLPIQEPIVIKKEKEKPADSNTGGQQNNNTTTDALPEV